MTRKEDEVCFGVLITAYFLIWDLRFEFPNRVCAREFLRIEVTWLFSFHFGRALHGSMKA